MRLERKNLERKTDENVHECKQCGRILNKMYRDEICPECKDLNLFAEVKDYILSLIHIWEVYNIYSDSDNIFIYNYFDYQRVKNILADKDMFGNIEKIALLEFYTVFSENDVPELYILSLIHI